MFPKNNLLEDSLFKLLKQNELSAFELLYKLYYVQLCNYAITFIRLPEIAEEIVQETFIKVWEKRDKININTSWRAYIYRSVHNHCIDYIRKSQVLIRQKEKVIDEIKFQVQIANLNFGSEIIDKLICEDLAIILNNTLNQLPDQCKTIFLMSREDNLSYAEIADKLNISTNTVKTQMKRALRQFRDSLDKHS